MDIIRKKPGIASYVQVKEEISKKILNGELSPGQQLPTERELAKEMQISRTTASAAYGLLEKEGFIASKQGKGTFVRDDLALPTTSRKERIIEAIDQVIDLAVQLGFSIDEFSSFVGVRTFQYGLSPRKLNVLFVDCNEEQIFLFTRRLQKDPKLSVQSILLSDLASLKNSALIKKADVIVTTIRHLQQVRDVIDTTEQILAIATTPNLEGLVQIANITRTEKVGLICSGRRFWEIFCRAMDAAGVATSNIIYYNRDTNKDMDEFIHSFSCLIVTPLCEKEVRTHLTTRDKIHIVPFGFEMDNASVNLVNEHIAKLKSQKRK